MARWIVILWLIAGGTGVAFSINRKRMKELTDMDRMIRLLRQMADQMTRYRIPMEEICKRLSGSGEGISEEILAGILQGIREKRVCTFQEIWLKEAEKLRKRKQVPEDFVRIWEDACRNLPSENAVLSRELSRSLEDLEEVRLACRKRFEKEKKPVMACGILSSLFLCLVLC